MQSSAFALRWTGLCARAHILIMAMIIISGNFKRVHLTDIAAAPPHPPKAVHARYYREAVVSGAVVFSAFPDVQWSSMHFSGAPDC